MYSVPLTATLPTAFQYHLFAIHSHTQRKDRQVFCTMICILSIPPLYFFIRNVVDQFRVVPHFNYALYTNVASIG